MKQSLSFRVTSYPESVDALIAFRNLNRAEKRDRRYFDWRYEARPCKQKPVILWAEVQGQQVGALSIFPHDFHIDEGTRTVGILGDISVCPEYRGQGIAGAMFRQLSRVETLQSLYGCLVLPNQEAAHPLARSGWQDAERIERFTKILDFAPRIARVARFGSIARIVAPAVNVVARWSSREMYGRNLTRYQGMADARIDARFDELWQRSDKRGRIIGVRDKEYLRWRYQDHPLTPYHVFTLTTRDQLCGYIMHRQSGDLCYIDDIFCDNDRSSALQLVAHFLAHMRAQRESSAVTININQSYLALPWRHYGFVRRRDYQRVMTSECAARTGILQEPGDTRWHISAGDKDV